MSLPPTQFLAAQLQALESVKLGRFTTSVTNLSDASFHDLRCPRPSLRSQTLTTTRTALQITASATDSLSYAAHLLNLLRSFFDLRAQRTRNSTVDTLKRYKLSDSWAWFRRACADTETRAWLEHEHEAGNTIYMIVEIGTLTGGVFVEGSASEEAVDVFGTTTTALAGAGAEHRPSHASTSSSRMEFRHAEEVVYVVGLLKVEFRWFRSGRFDEAYLAQPYRWKVYMELRGGDEGKGYQRHDGEGEGDVAGDNDGDKDAIEVLLSNVLDPEDEAAFAPVFDDQGQRYLIARD